MEENHKTMDDKHGLGTEDTEKDEIVGGIMGDLLKIVGDVTEPRTPDTNPENAELQGIPVLEKPDVKLGEQNEAVPSTSGSILHTPDVSVHQVDSEEVQTAYLDDIMERLADDGKSTVDVALLRQLIYGSMSDGAQEKSTIDIARLRQLIFGPLQKVSREGKDESCRKDVPEI